MELQHNQATLIFAQLEGSWNLSRDLQSANAAEPSGKCSGIATLTAREPSVFIDKDGQLQRADAELLYHEQGDFELYQAVSGSTPIPRFPFSRKYVWRLQSSKGEDPSIMTVWFTKPGTDTIDYLFHKVDIQSNGAVAASELQTGRCIEGGGCHLCEEDFYSSSYTFQLSNMKTDEADSTAVSNTIQNWMMVHEVRGPKKDQYIETKFTRA